jgi:hypothetical protein
MYNIGGGGSKNANELCDNKNLARPDEALQRIDFQIDVRELATISLDQLGWTR